ncbi:DDE-type integrase/transposase/recombinase [Sphingobium fuliginis ATCC 27551]|uniref:DDE-type integrase/transposase/recombinase n=1 Tax=Sphingobium fuliginis ATCC 27551 TaxID=1208342 RepID=A0A5B8CDR1_SPHSA|nr:DDE-type integrase/transposase/recombinase [Sphingobium fuliginis ATCC 27551]
MQERPARLCRCSVRQRRVRPDVVVVVAPDRQLASGVYQAVKQLLVQEFVAQRPVERFNEGILLRLARIDVVPPDPLSLAHFAFSLDCCDREAMGFVATTAGISAEDVRDLMTATVEHRFGRVNRLPATIEWLTDNGSCYTARETCRFAREINLRPRTTPIESPQSNGMAEAFVRTMKRNYVRVAEKPNARAVINQLPSWCYHYNTVHPHRALGYLAPREYIIQSDSAEMSGI